MWDLENIVRQNNEYALDAMMKGVKLEVAQAPTPQAWPLTILAEKLKTGPPLLSEVIACLENINTVAGFYELISMLMPEHEAEIMAEPRNRRLYRFNYLFGKKYYPLPLNTECSIGDLLNGMPVELMAMSYSAYHNLDMRPGYLLLLSLVIYPYEGGERDAENDDVPFDPFDPMKRWIMEAKLAEIAKRKPAEWRPKRSDIAWVEHLMATLGDGGKWIAPMGFTIIKIDDRNIELRQADATPEVQETIHRTILIAEKAGIKVKVHIGRTAEEKMSGARVPLLDQVVQLVGGDLSGRIPMNGWHPEELHFMTDKTPYDGVGDFADWACSQTGCVMLDSSYDDCEFIEGYGEPIFKWTKQNVDILTAQYPKVLEIRRKIDHMVEWLEADQINHFRQLMEFLLIHQPRTFKSPKAEHSYDPTDHWCNLEQEVETEDDDDDNDEERGV